MFPPNLARRGDIQVTLSLGTDKGWGVGDFDTERARLRFTDLERSSLRSLSLLLLGYCPLTSARTKDFSHFKPSGG